MNQIIIYVILHMDNVIYIPSTLTVAVYCIKYITVDLVNLVTL